ncbi:hypothetical protein D9M70_626200 [compost metagenome]
MLGLVPRHQPTGRLCRPQRGCLRHSASALRQSGRRTCQSCASLLPSIRELSGRFVGVGYSLEGMATRRAQGLPAAFSCSAMALAKPNQEVSPWLVR